VLRNTGRYFILKLNLKLFRKVNLNKLSVYMAIVTQFYFQVVEEINYMFRPFSECAIIRLKLEMSEKTHTLQCGLYIKNKTRSRSPILDV
jgi:hypothetical protein